MKDWSRIENRLDEQCPNSCFHLLKTVTTSRKKCRGWFWLVENPCGWFQMSLLLPPLTKIRNLKFVGIGQYLKSVQEFQQFWASPWREDLPGWLLTHATHLSIVLSLDILLFTTFNAIPTKAVTNFEMSPKCCRFWTLGSICWGRCQSVRSEGSPPSPCLPWMATPLPPCLRRSLLTLTLPFADSPSVAGSIFCFSKFVLKFQFLPFEIIYQVNCGWLPDFGRFLACDCRLRWVARWIRDHDLQVRYWV